MRITDSIGFGLREDGGGSSLGEPQLLGDSEWEAVAACDGSRDGEFFYAVRTTGIFCRPSCRSRLPNRENAGLFRTFGEALAAGYRPCKRCRPTGELVPDEDWITLAQRFIRAHYAERLTLEALAAACHGSPFHLHRTFHKIVGVTPVEYIQQVRAEAAKELLLSTDLPVAAVGKRCGWPNTPYFTTLFKKMTGMTPAAYRRNAADRKGERIHERTK
ncbi:MULTISPECIES: bifunctional transcriptional activator/DNA repair enzyme AdaA [Paenibacillus]|nr:MULTISPECIES: bifunctional transcriptional activator/DNA repair enzyme AdaA [Paenibacillus]CDN46023.1 Bifunctional transcriptional activator/DNA repair enzyme AdaA [Paenibacillus sp. P22]